MTQHGWETDRGSSSMCWRPTSWCLGYTIPPQADAGRIGAAGPGRRISCPLPIRQPCQTPGMRASQSDLADVIVRSANSDARLVAAFRTVPRAGFVPPQLAELAYEDRPLPIAHGQVTTQPSLSAQMIDALELTPDSRVLEVGTGLGFQTALLATLAARVTSIERWPDLAEQARTHLARHGITNVEVRIGDGSLGVPDAAPFDAILVSAAYPEVPRSLVAQLRERSRLVQPIGEGGNDAVTLFRKEADQLRRVRVVVPARFVRLIGDEAFPDDSR